MYAEEMRWDYGDGSSGKEPRYIYQMPGRCQVTLIVKNTRGMDRAVVIIDVTEPPKPVAKLRCITEKYSQIAGKELTFIDQSENAPTAWEWDFGDGTPTVSGSPQVKHTYEREGRYTITLITRNNSGVCERPATDTVAIKSQPPGPKAKFKVQTIAGKKITLKDQSINGPDSYLWDFGNGGKRSEPNPTYQYREYGTYIITLTVKNEWGTDTYAQQVTIVPLPKPIARFKASKPKWNGHAELEVAFTNQSRNAERYEWDFGDKHPSREKDPYHSYYEKGKYTITLTAVNADGETDTQTKKIHVKKRCGLKSVIKTVLAVFFLLMVVTMVFDPFISGMWHSQYPTVSSDRGIASIPISTSYQTPIPTTSYSTPPSPTPTFNQYRTIHIDYPSLSGYFPPDLPADLPEDPKVAYILSNYGKCKKDYNENVAAYQLAVADLQFDTKNTVYLGGWSEYTRINGMLEQYRSEINRIGNLMNNYLDQFNALETTTEPVTWRYQVLPALQPYN